MPGSLPILRAFALNFIITIFRNIHVTMEYPSIIEEALPDYAKKATWNVLYAHIDAHSKRLSDEFLGYGVQDI